MQLHNHKFKQTNSDDLDLIDHSYYMQIALEAAKKAFSLKEVPVGAVLLIKDGEFFDSCNMQITHNDPTAHAEILALRKASNKIKNYRILNSILYTTLEPCMMCFGAALHARIDYIVFGAYDHKFGVMSKNYDLEKSYKTNSINHKIQWIPGILQEECSNLLKNFFIDKR